MKKIVYVSVYTAANLRKKKTEGCTGESQGWGNGGLLSMRITQGQKDWRLVITCEIKTFGKNH